jgi:hypothetical protein
MPTKHNQQYKRTGSFVPTTQIWQGESDKSLIIKLYLNINRIALVLNTKETGAYYQQEFVTGALLFPNPATGSNSNAPAPTDRQISRVCINFGALPSAAFPIKSVAHNLIVGANWSFLKIYGASTNPTLFNTPPVPFTLNFIPLPYISVADPTGNLQLSVDQQYINIETAGTDYSAWTITYIILEFVTS